MSRISEAEARAEVWAASLSHVEATTVVVLNEHVHGLRRTNHDKREAVKALLADEECRHWSNREIAKKCGVHQGMVARCRATDGGLVSEERAYVTKHGTPSVMRVRRIGRGKNGLP